MTFGKLLKQIRTARKLTLAALAEGLDLDAPRLSRYENGTGGTPSRVTIQRIVRGLDLSTVLSDKLHVLAGRIPSDVEDLLINQPQLIEMVREKGKQ